MSTENEFILQEGQFEDQSAGVTGECTRIDTISFPNTTINDNKNLYLFEISFASIRAKYAVWLNMLRHADQSYAVILFIQGTTQEALDLTLPIHPIEYIMNYIINQRGEKVGIAISEERRILSALKLRDKYCQKDPIISEVLPDGLKVYLVSSKKRRAKTILQASEPS